MFDCSVNAFEHQDVMSNGVEWTTVSLVDVGPLEDDLLMLGRGK